MSSSEEVRRIRVMTANSKGEPTSLKDIKKRLREMTEWCKYLKSGRLCLISWRMG